jgi:hypothetical protein
MSEKKIYYFVIVDDGRVAYISFKSINKKYIDAHASNLFKRFNECDEVKVGVAEFNNWTEAEKYTTNINKRRSLKNDTLP